MTTMNGQIDEDDNEAEDFGDESGSEEEDFGTIKVNKELFDGVDDEDDLDDLLEGDN